MLNVTDKKQTCVDNLQVSLPIVNHVLIAGRHLQKKGKRKADIVQHQSLKYEKNVSCIDHLSFVQNVTNVPVIALDRHVGARLHKFWKIWEALGASSTVITIVREGYILPFQIRPNQTRSPTYAKDCS